MWYIEPSYGTYPIHCKNHETIITCSDRCSFVALYRMDTSHYMQGTTITKFVPKGVKILEIHYIDVPGKAQLNFQTGFWCSEMRKTGEVKLALSHFALVLLVMGS